MDYVIKTEITELKAKTFDFPKQKTMYGGKQIKVGDVVFIIASENEGGPGLIAHGIVSSVKATPLKKDVARQTPRVSISVQRKALAKRALGRNELKSFTQWKDDQPQTELNFKLYRQATNKIVGISDQASSFLQKFF